MAQEQVGNFATMNTQTSINSDTETAPIAAQRTAGPAAMMRSFGSLFGTSNGGPRRLSSQTAENGYVEFGMQDSDGSGRTLGTFAGVFSPVALSMFSALVFIRVGKLDFKHFFLSFTSVRNLYNTW